MTNQKIYCDVIMCKFNNHNNLCTLNKIKVSCNKNDVTNKSDTICNSFTKEKE